MSKNESYGTRMKVLVGLSSSQSSRGKTRPGPFPEATWAPWLMLPSLPAISASTLLTPSCLPSQRRW